MKKFIAVAGNIGVGKSTLVRLLCDRLGYYPFFEPVVENPYLSDFYDAMSQWSFHSQVFFLSHRLRIHKELTLYPGPVMQDRSIYEDAEVFARNLYLQGNMAEHDYATYHALYQTMADYLPPPDLIIYLRASVPTLLKRIEQRNRDYERSISGEYLAQLNQLYEEWIASFTFSPVLTVPADNLDYVAHPRLIDLVAQKIQERLVGKDEVVFTPDEMKRSD